MNEEDIWIDRISNFGVLMLFLTFMFMLLVLFTTFFVFFWLSIIAAAIGVSALVVVICLEIWNKEVEDDSEQD